MFKVLQGERRKFMRKLPDKIREEKKNRKRVKKKLPSRDITLSFRIDCI